RSARSTSGERARPTSPPAGSSKSGQRARSAAPICSSRLTGCRSPRTRSEQDVRHNSHPAVESLAAGSRGNVGAIWVLDGHFPPVDRRAGRYRPGTVAQTSLISTAEGTSQAAFGATEWALVLAVSAIWGSSFFLIAEALEGFAPATVAMLRLTFGVLTLSCLAAAREPLAAEDRPRAALLGVTWMAFPLAMFPIAEQWISSSVAGMLNGAMPILTAAVAILLLRRLPGRNQRIGMAVGCAGIVAIAVPTWTGGSRLAL